MWQQLSHKHKFTWDCWVGGISSQSQSKGLREDKKKYGSKQLSHNPPRNEIEVITSLLLSYKNLTIRKETEAVLPLNVNLREQRSLNRQFLLEEA